MTAESVSKEADLKTLQSVDASYCMPTYRRLPVSIVRGEGAYLWDDEGKQYLDFFSGIGVCNTGHCHPAVVEAVREQVGRLIHVSNFFYTEPAIRLCERFSKSSLGGKVFLCNSGAESIECAIKIARKRSYSKSGVAGGRIVVVERAFHGRTLGALSITPQPEKQDPFHPLYKEVDVVPRNDPDALASAVDDETIAVIVEPVQGEGGVHVISDEFLSIARDSCDRHDAILVFDEVQCGMGRTGTMWAYQQTGVVPDVMTSAKALAGGLPIGAVVAKEEMGDVFAVGDHASTFAGGPVVAAAALAALGVIDDEDFLFKVREMGEHFGDGLNRLVSDGKAADARGRGLMRAFDLPEGRSASELVMKGLEEGILFNAIGERTVRFLPPLVVEMEEVDEVLNFISENAGQV